MEEQHFGWTLMSMRGWEMCVVESGRSWVQVSMKRVLERMCVVEEWEEEL
jgi:hypothetical protein